MSLSEYFDMLAERRNREMKLESISLMEMKRRWSFNENTGISILIMELNGFRMAVNVAPEILTDPNTYDLFVKQNIKKFKESYLDYLEGESES